MERGLLAAIHFVHLGAARTRGVDGRAFGEYAAFFGLGLDGVFSDQADTALQAREWWLADRAA